MHREPHFDRSPGRAPAPDSGVSRVRPFHLRVEDAVLDDLHLRLARTRFSPARTGWKRGVDSTYLRELVDYWRDDYDWRAHEAKLDELPQFVDGSGLHFVHVRAGGSMPLLLLHGWPDSFYRYHAVVPLLVRAGFDVVVPSLPGFAFTPASPPAPQPNRRVAARLHRLMTDVLGYTRFGVAGGDGGSVLAQILAIDHPDAVAALHLTDLGWHATQVDPHTLSWRERRYVERVKKRFMADGAYAMVQTTRPRSLAPALADSPVGLASWIVDRFHAWSNGDLDARFGKDTLLTNIMLYWVTHSIGSSMFTYFADARSPSLTPADRVDVPVALALFPDIRAARRHVASPSARSRSRAGPRCRAAVTSRRSRSRSCTRATSSRGSRRCAVQVHPLDIRVADSTLRDLHARLATTQLPPDDATDWDAGTNPRALRELVDYWRDGYDWRAQEAELAAAGHFWTTLDGEQVHFIHERGRGEAPLPIVLTHGYPDSFLRFHALIPLLTDPAAHGGDARDAFHVVVPSLPGFAFSAPPAGELDVFHVADRWHALMTGLGYTRYGAHGGDWGSTVTEHLGRSHGNAVVGIHLTDVPFWHAFRKPKHRSAAEDAYLAAIDAFQRSAARTR